jgi:hypothetical protein
VWLGQAPRADELPGLGLLVAGVAIVVLGARRLVRLAPVPPDGA